MDLVIIWRAPSYLFLTLANSDTYFIEYAFINSIEK